MGGVSPHGIESIETFQKSLELSPLEPKTCFFDYSGNGIQTLLRKRDTDTTPEKGFCFGMVKLGLVWFGMVWYGLVWFGLVWFGLALFGMVWYDWYGLVWFGMVWHGLVWFGMV